MEYMMDVGYPANVGRFNSQQLLSRQQWTSVPDEDNVAAALHVITQERKSGTTVTEVNPLDPGNPATQHAWLEIPHDSGRVVPAGRMF